MKRTKKILVTLLCAVLLVTGTVAVTVAYLTSTTDVVQNTFTVGNVEITLDEALVTEDGKPAIWEKETNDKGEEVITGKTNVNSVEAADRTISNTYKLLPGLDYVKDPTVTVKAKSENSYVRIQVSVSDEDMAKLKSAFPKESIEGGNTYPDWYVNETAGKNTNEEEVFLIQNLVDGWENSNWRYKFYDVITKTSTGSDGKEIETTTHTYEFWYVGSKADEGIVSYTEVDVELEPLFTKVDVPDEMTNTAIAFLNNAKIDIVAHAIQADGFDNAEAAWEAFDE